MKKKSLLSVLIAAYSVTSIHVSSKSINAKRFCNSSIISKNSSTTTTYTYDLDILIIVSQKVNEKGLAIISGQFNKPFTNSNTLLSVKYQNTQRQWATGWCKTLYSLIN